MNKPNVREKFAATRTPVLAPASVALLDPPHAAQADGIPSHNGDRKPVSSTPRPVSPRKVRPPSSTPAGKRFAALPQDENGSNRQAELFYLQKQIQLQTQMVLVLEDGSRVQGVIEWYDRHSIKVRGKSRMLVYKSAIKYLYKQGEAGSDE
jgi:sRNA-binding regulator protein Hfq